MTYNQLRDNMNRRSSRRRAALQPAPGLRQPLDPADPSPLGALGRLPIEIRHMFYVEYTMQRRADLFATSNQIHDESMSFLRGQTILSFHIDPSSPKSEIGSEMYLLDSNGGRRPGIQHTIDVSSSHEDCAILDRLPLDRFRQIQILIDAPKPADPGQLVRCWYQTKRLLAILLPRWRDPDSFPQSESEDILVAEGRDSTVIPPFEVTFLDNDERKWWHTSTEGTALWNRSVPCATKWEKGMAFDFTPCICAECTDFRYIIDLFQKVRNVRRRRRQDEPAITIRAKHPDDAVEPVLDDLKTMTDSRTPFGLILETTVPTGAHTWAFGDAAVLDRENAHYIWLDYVMEKLGGDTALSLACERHATWCLEYERAVARSADGYNFPTTKKKFGAGILALKRYRFCYVYRSHFRWRFWRWARLIVYTDEDYATYRGGYDAYYRTLHAGNYLRQDRIEKDLIRFPPPNLTEFMSRATFDYMQSEMLRLKHSRARPSPKPGFPIKCELLWTRDGCCQRCPAHVHQDGADS